MKYNYSSNSNDYKTPPVLYKKALDKFGINKFSCDVCCSDENIPAVNYCKQHETDGLKEEWAYKYWFYCWCNPPFKYCIKWVKKAFEESRKGINVAMLIPALYDESPLMRTIVKAMYRFSDQLIENGIIEDRGQGAKNDKTRKLY